MDITDKVIVVTGGGGGIGRGMCERFAAEGARKLVVADLDLASATAVADSVGGEAAACNVRDEAQIQALVARVEGDHGRIDMFCSNAGIADHDGPTGMATGSDNGVWQAMWEVHVMAHVYAARACLPAMLERGEGYFLNTVSAAGILSQIGGAAYATTKHAAVGFAESLAITHGDAGIGVSMLCPQAVDTALISQLGEEGEGVAGLDGILTPAEVAAAVVEGLAEKRFLILPHPQVEQYHQRKSADYDRWLGGMRKLRRSL